MSRRSIADLINGLAEDLGLNEQSVALLRDIAGRVHATDLERVAEALSAGERVRHRRGWTEVIHGDVTGNPETISGTCDALKVMVGKLPPSGGRSVFVLYAKGPKGAKS